MMFSADAMEACSGGPKGGLIVMKKEQCVVIDQQEIASSIFELTLQGDIALEMGEPGQFVHLKVTNGSDPSVKKTNQYFKHR